MSSQALEARNGSASRPAGSPGGAGERPRGNDASTVPSTERSQRCCQRAGRYRQLHQKRLRDEAGYSGPPGSTIPIPTDPQPPPVIPDPGPTVVIKGDKQQIVNPTAGHSESRLSRAEELLKAPQINEAVRDPKNFKKLTPPTAQPPPAMPKQEFGRFPFAYKRNVLTHRPARAPGGISLTTAAAERMALNISLEGAHAENGRLVLASGIAEKVGASMLPCC